MQYKNNDFIRLWGMPIWLSVITIIGLILAIMGTGIWHFMAWLALCIPLYVMCKHGRKFFNKRRKI